MKRFTLLLVAFLCISAYASSNEEIKIIKRGGSIGTHLGEGTALTKQYGDPKQLLDSPVSVPATTEVMMWKVGDGILVIETSFSAGFIKNISYVITDSQKNKRTTLTVKQFNPATREMTIIVPNQNLERTRNTAPLK